MTVQLLIDSLVRQVTVLIAQLATLVCVHVENGLEYPVAEGCVNAFFDVLACQTNCADRYGNPCD